MNDRERKRIELIIADELASADKSLTKDIEGVYAEHSAKGVLRSGYTIKAVMRSCEQSANKFLDILVAKLQPILPDAETFLSITTALNALLDNIESHKTRLLGVSNASAAGAVDAVDELMKEIREGIGRRMEITSFDFDQAVVIEINKPPAFINRGGKPLAAHWDAMWATIAVALFTGDLRPKSQADIETAIKQWFSDNNLDVGDTAARARARILWQKYQVAE